MLKDDAKAAIMPEWLTPRQAQAYANLSLTTLWELRKRNKIKAARVGRAVRIQRDSLEEFMKQSSGEN